MYKQLGGIPRKTTEGVCKSSVGNGCFERSQNHGKSPVSNRRVARGGREMNMCRKNITAHIDILLLDGYIGRKKVK